MAAKKIPRAVVKLSPEHKDRMIRAKEDIEGAEHGISVLKELGMDVTELEEKMAWVKKTREILLREFG